MIQFRLSIETYQLKISPAKIHNTIIMFDLRYYDPWYTLLLCILHEKKKQKLNYHREEKFNFYFQIISTQISISLGKIDI